MKKKLKIDPDILASAKEYADKQLAVLKKYNSKIVLTEQGYNDLIIACAQYPQELRNLTKKKHVN
jgi:hypothetical protein